MPPIYKPQKGRFEKGAYGVVATYPSPVAAMVNAPAISNGNAYTTLLESKQHPNWKILPKSTSTIPPNECQEIIQVPTVFEGVKVFPSHFGQC